MSRNSRERYWVHSQPGGDGPLCLVCKAPVNGAVLCSRTITDTDPKGGCTEQLEKDLAELPGWVEDLEISRTRQNVGASRNGSRGNERPLPWDNRATLALGALQLVLVAIVRDLGAVAPWLRAADGGPVCDWTSTPCTHPSCAPFWKSGWPADDPAAMSRWLLTALPRIRQSDHAADVFRAIRRAVQAVQWVVDRRPDRWYAGQCQAEITLDPHVTRQNLVLRLEKGDEAGDYCCVVDLYAIPDESDVKCDTCKTVHDAKARKEWLLAAAEDVLANAATCARAITAWDQPVTSDRIRQWAARGRLAAKGIDWNGKPTYRIGDVLDRLGEDYQSAERRAQKAAARALQEDAAEMTRRAAEKSKTDEKIVA